jgi:hypothetical protein
MLLDVSTIKKKLFSFFRPRNLGKTTTDVACEKTTPHKSKEKYKIIQVSQQGIFKSVSVHRFGQEMNQAWILHGPNF